ncbi:MAG: hypothetical protein AB7K24_32815, partial [Gemmataceae bacterium]
WPFVGGACTCWTDRIVAVGWDFAERVYREQRETPASREFPVEVAGGRLRDGTRREAGGGPSYPSWSEVMAHEIGHTYQALYLPLVYLPVVGSVTIFREGKRWWNFFENQASELGQFGGFVPGTICQRLLDAL